MSDTSGLPNTDSEGVPVEEDTSRFESGNGSGNSADADRDAQTEEPTETADSPGAGAGGDSGSADSGSGDSGSADSGAQAEPDPTTGTAASTGVDGAEPPPAELDPAQNPSNPDLVDTTEAPD
ncbi:hypothetical protein GCM10027406_28800 [Leifsonia lichenia]